MKIISVAVLATALAVLGACTPAAEQSTTAASPPAAQAPAAPAPQATAAAPIDGLVNDQMLGAAVTSFETLAGTPREVNGDDRVYQVGGCSLSVHVANNQVRTIRTAIGPECDPMVNGRRLRGQTIAAASAALGEGVYNADCLASCGNAADPEHYFQSMGSRANGSKVVRLSTIGDDAFFDRRNAVVQRITARHSEAYVVDGGWRCRPEWRADLQQLISPAAITSVTLGFEEDLRVECAA